MFSGPRDGLLSSRRLLTRIQAWTSTSTSQVTRRQRNLFLPIILKNQVLLLKPTPPLPRLFRLLTSKSLYSSPPARPWLLYFSSRVYLFVFFLLGLGPKTYVASSLMNIHFFFIVCVSAGVFCAFLYELHDLNWVYELSSKTEPLRLRGLSA